MLLSAPWGIPLLDSVSDNFDLLFLHMCDVSLPALVTM